jgi:hypothetical protein
MNKMHLKRTHALSATLRFGATFSSILSLITPRFSSFSILKVCQWGRSSGISTNGLENREERGE